MSVFIPGMFSMPFMFSIAPGDGLAFGIFIPGMFGIAPGEGLAFGIGMFICCGDEDGEGLAVGICIPGMLCI